MPETKRLLKVFLCHAHSDKADVKALYERLVEDGVDAWLDKEKLLPGQDWELEIRKAVRESDVIVVCLSKDFNKAGFRQKEVRLALDTAMEQPEGEIFIIPARLEECDTLESLRKWHWVDLFEDDGYEMLLGALRVRADSIGATLQVKKGWMSRISSPRVKPEKTVEEDPSATSSGEATAKKADIDNKTRSSRIPSVAARKPFKLKTEYVVAIIGAVATIVAAVIGSPLIERWFSQTPASTATATMQVLVSPTPGSAYPLGATIQHPVDPGESLFQIARCYGADYGSLLSANPQISNPRNLLPGTTISVPNIGSVGKVYGPPCAIFYTVQIGDTWQSIASKFNADPSLLMEANKGAVLVTGTTILIPSSSIQPILVSSTLFTVDAELSPNRDNCYSVIIPLGQKASFTTTTSVDRVVKVVQDPNEEVFEDSDDLIFGGNPDADSGSYRYCIFNRSDSSIRYTLEVSLFQ